MMSRAIVVPLSAAAVAWPQDSVTRLLQTLREEIKTDQAVRDVQTIWETDRWFTFPKFEETARNVAAIMRRAGLEDVEIRNPPADGVTQAGYWTMPLAWDVKVATLEIVEPEVAADMRVLADYQKVPTSVVMWSGPTPKGGVVTEVVLPSGNLAGMDLKGKLVLGARGAKTALAKAGALGLISENTENPGLVDECGWVNSFGDHGWSFTKGSSPRESGLCSGSRVAGGALGCGAEGRSGGSGFVRSTAESPAGVSGSRSRRGVRTWGSLTGCAASQPRG